MDEALARELDAIPWFDAVGQPVTTALPFSIIQVATWAEAFACWDDAWEARRSRAYGDLRTYLARHDPDRLEGWSEIVRSVKGRSIGPLEARAWRPLTSIHEVHPLLPDLVSWDVLIAAMEHEYRRIPGRPVFYLHLLEVYRLGHFPCGWVGDWPEGVLVVL